MPGAVLVLTSTYPRWKDDTEPRFVEFLSQQLAATRKVVVLAPHCEGAARHEVDRFGKYEIEIYRFRYAPTSFQSLAYDGGMLHRLRQNPVRIIWLALFMLSQWYWIAKLHRRYGFSAVHAHWIIPQGIIATCYRLFQRSAPRLLVTSHGGDLYALRGRILLALKRWVLNRADSITVVSQAMRDECARIGIDTSKVHVASMGVDLTTQFTPRNNAGAPNSLVFVGRLVEKKGVEVLLRAMPAVLEQHPEAHLTIVGHGPERERLEKLAEFEDIVESVRFLGGKKHDELPALFRESAIAVMPSVVARTGDQEGLGLVAIEAMGCGCAVVSTDLPAIADSVQNKRTGLVARSGDASDLARCINELLASPALRQQLAEQGRSFAIERFDWPIVGQRYNDLLDRLENTST